MPEPSLHRLNSSLEREPQLTSRNNLLGRGVRSVNKNYWEAYQRASQPRSVRSELQRSKTPAMRKPWLSGPLSIPLLSFSLLFFLLTCFVLCLPSDLLFFHLLPHSIASNAISRTPSVPLSLQLPQPISYLNNPLRDSKKGSTTSNLKVSVYLLKWIKAGSLSFLTKAAAYLASLLHISNDLHTLFEHVTKNGPKELRTFEPNPQIMKELQPAIFRAANPRCRPYVSGAFHRAFARYLDNIIMHSDSTARQLALKTGEVIPQPMAITRTRWLKHSLDRYFDMVHHKLGQFADSSLVWGWAMKNLPRLINMQMRHYTLVTKKVVDDYQITSADWWTERTRWFERVRFFGSRLCSC